MDRTAQYLLLFACWITLSLAAFYDKKSGVINADQTNFDSIVTGAPENDVVLVEFYAPWCGHCKQLQPEYIKAAKKLKDLAKVVAVDASDEKNRGIAQQFQIQGFPTLKVFKGGRPSDYQGERSAKGMVDYVLGQLPNYVQRVSEKSEKKFFKKNADLPKALLFTKKAVTSPLYKRFSALLQGKMALGEVRKDKALKNKYGISPEAKTALIVFAAGSDKYDAYTGKMTYSGVGEFFSRYVEGFDVGAEEQLPVLQDESCFQRHCVSRGLCVILITGEDKEEGKRVHSYLKQVEETVDAASHFGFSQINAQGNEGKNLEWLNGMFGDLNVLYSNVVIVSPRKKRFALYVGSFETDSLASFVTGILRGRTSTRPLRSGKGDLPQLDTSTEKCPKPKPKPKPKKPKAKPNQQQRGGRGGQGQRQQYDLNSWKSAQPGGGSPYMIHLDSSNFNDMIQKTDVPAMVEFYAPWCGHCKSLAPQYAKAANKAQGMVLFGSVDCTVEQSICSKYGVRGYPTLKLFGFGKKRKKSPQDYQGGRDANSMSSAALNLLYGVKINKVTGEDVEEFAATPNKAKIILVTSKKKPPTAIRALKAQIEEDRLDVVIGSASDTDLVNKLGLESEKLPAIVGYYAKTNEKEVFKGQASFVKIVQFAVKMIAQGMGAEEPQEEKVEL